MLRFLGFAAAQNRAVSKRHLVRTHTRGNPSYTHYTPLFGPRTWYTNTSIWIKGLGREDENGERKLLEKFHARDLPTGPCRLDF